jgi:hypothetical protein
MLRHRCPSGSKTPQSSKATGLFALHPCRPPHHPCAISSQQLGRRRQLAQALRQQLQATAAAQVQAAQRRQLAQALWQRQTAGSAPGPVRAGCTRGASGAAGSTPWWLVRRRLFTARSACTPPAGAAAHAAGALTRAARRPAPPSVRPCGRGTRAVGAGVVRPSCSVRVPGCDGGCCRRRSGRGARAGRAGRAKDSEGRGARPGVFRKGGLEGRRGGRRARAQERPDAAPDHLHPHRLPATTGRASRGAACSCPPHAPVARAGAAARAPPPRQRPARHAPAARLIPKRRGAAAPALRG